MYDLHLLQVVRAIVTVLCELLNLWILRWKKFVRDCYDV